MAGYVKIWIDIRFDSWFISLSLGHRGMFYELLTLAKQQGDTGVVRARSWVWLGSETGCDGKTARNILGKFRDDGKVKLEQTPSGTIHIIIAKYDYWQRLRKAGDRYDNSEKGKESTTYNPSINEPNTNTNLTEPYRTNTKRKKSSGKKPENKNKQIIELIIHDLNEKSGKNYKYCESNVDIIDPRLKEGRKPEDFFHINTVKCQEWLNTEKAMYIRPETLYAKKHFESYLNQMPPDNRFSDITKHNIQVGKEWLAGKKE